MKKEGQTSEQLSLGINGANGQTEIDSSLAEGEALMSSDEKESGVPRIITKKKLEEERERARAVRDDSLRRVKEILK